MSVPRLTVRRLGGGIIAAVAALGLAPFTAAATTGPTGERRRLGSGRARRGS